MFLVQSQNSPVQTSLWPTILSHRIGQSTQDPFHKVPFRDQGSLSAPAQPRGLSTYWVHSFSSMWMATIELLGLYCVSQANPFPSNIAPSLLHIFLSSKEGSEGS